MHTLQVIDFVGFGDCLRLEIGNSHTLEMFNSVSIGYIPIVKDGP